MVRISGTIIHPTLSNFPSSRKSIFSIIHCLKIVTKVFGMIGVGMGRCLLGLILGFFCFQNAIAQESSLSSVYLGSREGDPASLVENVSTMILLLVIHGDIKVSESIQK